jgi:uncharacterized membrane protein YccC
MDRIDIGQAVLLVGVCAALVVLVTWGPHEHKTMAATALVGLVGTVAAAARGRLVKRDPASFKDGEQ